MTKWPVLFLIFFTACSGTQENPRRGTANSFQRGDCFSLVRTIGLPDFGILGLKKNEISGEDILPNIHTYHEDYPINLSYYLMRGGVAESIERQPQKKFKKSADILLDLLNIHLAGLSQEFNITPPLLAKMTRDQSDGSNMFVIQNLKFLKSREKERLYQSISFFSDESLFQTRKSPLIELNTKLAEVSFNSPTYIENSNRLLGQPGGMNRRFVIEAEPQKGIDSNYLTVNGGIVIPRKRSRSPVGREKDVVRHLYRNKKRDQLYAIQYKIAPDGRKEWISEEGLRAIKNKDGSYRLEAYTQDINGRKAIHSQNNCYACHSIDPNSGEIFTAKQDLDSAVQMSLSRP
jgi:hypothetical protein